MDRSRIITLYHTVKYLKIKQIYYRGYYFLRNRLFKKRPSKKELNSMIPLNWNTPVFNTPSFLLNNKFSFLNLAHKFKNKIDWNYADYGKLWTFNLNYFDFLNQESLETKDGIHLINDFIANDVVLLDGKEAYTISLRAMNWIKFLSKNKIQDASINQNLYQHCQILAHNLEYHLLGNHLMENGFALFFAAYYFKDELLYKKAKKILSKELEEQILTDGAHFELSPMYHQIMLHRLLDCVQLAKLNNWKKDNLLSFMTSKASSMLTWLQTITFKNGAIPMVNDSAFGIAPSSNQLFTYAKKLDFIWVDKVLLSASGYRVFQSIKAELFVDVGDISPSYQPAHAHSDTFNFELYVNEIPIIVDTGTSTYEKNTNRQKERETAAHNTVKIGDSEQTQVWGGFRVAKRAKIIDIKEGVHQVTATHDGYADIGVLHTRKFKVQENLISILDDLSIKSADDAVAYFHFHPDITEIIVAQTTVKLPNQNINFSFLGDVVKIEKEKYDFALGFNKTKSAQKLKVFFKSSLETNIEI